MRRTALIILMLLLSFQVKAQFLAGAAFDINFRGTSTTYSEKTTDNSWGVSIAPQAAYLLNEKFMVGGTLSFDWKNNLENSYNALSGDSGDKKVIANQFGWSIAPFARYRLLEFNRFGVWMDSHVYFGMNHPMSGEGYYKPSFDKEITYGIQISPVVSFSLNEKTMINFHISVLSAGFAGTRTWKTNGTIEDVSHFRMFTGKISGIFNTLLQEGWYGFKISTIRKF